MPTITLKNLPRELHRELKMRAKANHRSLNGEVIATLQRATGSAGAIDAELLLREARQARTEFNRRVTAREINAWKQRGRL